MLCGKNNTLINCLILAVSNFHQKGITDSLIFK